MLVCTLLLGSRFKNCILCIRAWDSEAFKYICVLSLMRMLAYFLAGVTKVQREKITWAR